MTKAPGKGRKKADADARAERLKKALKANLRRRKEQAGKRTAKAGGKD